MSLRKDVTGDIAKHVTPRVTQNKSLPVSNFFLLVNGFLLNGCRKYFSRVEIYSFFRSIFPVKYFLNKSRKISCKSIANCRGMKHTKYCGQVPSKGCLSFVSCKHALPSLIHLSRAQLRRGRSCINNCLCDCIFVEFTQTSDFVCRSSRWIVFLCLIGATVLPGYSLTWLPLLDPAAMSYYTVEDVKVIF